jgi:energy-coupling factor transport system substrate-specific component
MDFAFWPYATGMHSQLSWDPQASVWHNLHTFLLYTLATSLAWNIGRAITNVTALAVVGPGVLRVLRRANRRAFFVDED